MLISMEQKISFDSHDTMPRVAELIYRNPKCLMESNIEDVMVPDLGSVEYAFNVCHSLT